MEVLGTMPTYSYVSWFICKYLWTTWVWQLFCSEVQPIADRVAQHLEIISKNFQFSTRRTKILMGCTIYFFVLIVNPMGRILLRWNFLRNNLEMLCHPICNWLHLQTYWYVTRRMHMQQDYRDSCMCNMTRESADQCAHCNTLQHTTSHHSTLQHIATHCNTLQRLHHDSWECHDLFTYVCSVRHW